MFSRILPISKHHYNIERVKFGVPLDQVCGMQNVIPGPLLILILKLNKEAPYKKDVFRAPGHQANMKKLIHFLQNGRLVNMDKFSVYTIASVLKKFLRKIPGGIFGPDIEAKLFEIIHKDNLEEKREEIHRLLISLPIVNQHLLVLLFGTFRAIASSSDKAITGMTSEAIGVSVAPSFFQSCVSDGSKIAKMEDVHRFKVATTIMKFLIDNFGVSNLFGRENYEYYARISGRVLKVEENWIFAFRYPPDTLIPRKTSLEVKREWLHNEAQRWGLPLGANRQLKEISASEECQSTPTLCPSTSGVNTSTRIGDDGSAKQSANVMLKDEAYARLSMSLEENVFKVTNKNVSQMVKQQGTTSPASFGNYYPNSHQQMHFQYFHQNQPNQLFQQQQQQQTQQQQQSQPQQQFLQEKNQKKHRTHNDDDSINLDELKVVNRYAESTKSLTFLPMVHERQTQRMKTRSEWFLNPCDSPSASSSSNKPPSTSNSSSSSITSSSQMTSRPIIRRTSSKEKRLIRRSSSKKDKENGNKSQNQTLNLVTSVGVHQDVQQQLVSSTENASGSTGHCTSITDSDCTEMDVQSFHFTLTYKPRI